MASAWVPLRCCANRAARAGACILLLCAAWACSGGDAFEVSRQFTDVGWAYQDSITGAFDAQAGKRYVLRAEVVFTDAYPYRNAYFKTSVQPPQDSARTALSEFMLAEETGQWRVDKSFWRGGYPYRFVLDSLTCRHSGACRFTVKQYMRDDTLKGVKALRLAWRPAD